MPNLIPYLAIWSLLALAVIALLVTRKIVAGKEDDHIHVLDGVPVTQQTVVAHKLDVIDRWGKILTALAVAGGLAIAALYVYSSFGTRGL